MEAEGKATLEKDFRTGDNTTLMYAYFVGWHVFHCHSDTRIQTYIHIMLFYDDVRSIPRQEGEVKEGEQKMQLSAMDNS